MVPQTTKPSEPWRGEVCHELDERLFVDLAVSSNGVTIAVMTDPMPGTAAIIPHVVEVEPRDDVRVVVTTGRGPVDAALRAGGAAHLAALRGRLPAMHDGAVLAMTAVRGGTVHARVAGYFDMVATGDALAPEPALRARAAALADGDPLRRGDGRVAAIGLSVATALPDGRVVLGRRRADLPLDPGAWHVVPSGMLEPERDPIGGALAREALEELGVAVDPARRACSGSAGTSRGCAPRCAWRSRWTRCRRGRAATSSTRSKPSRSARTPAALTPGAACALSLIGEGTRASLPRSRSAAHEHRRDDRCARRRGPRPRRDARLRADVGLVFYEDGRTESGIWEVTPGVFDAAHGRYVEFMHFVAGDATITAADGQVHEVRPGVALTVPPGWRARWEVRETVRKTYVIVRDGR